MTKKAYIISVFVLILFFGLTSNAFATLISTTSPQVTEIVRLSDIPLNSTVGVYSPCEYPVPYTSLITFYNGGSSDILLDPFFMTLAVMRQLVGSQEPIMFLYLQMAQNPASTSKKKNSVFARQKQLSNLLLDLAL